MNNYYYERINKVWKANVLEFLIFEYIKNVFEF